MYPTNSRIDAHAAQRTHMLRSDEAYDRAAAGKGDAAAFRVVETTTEGITPAVKS